MVSVGFTFYKFKNIRDGSFRILKFILGEMAVRYVKFSGNLAQIVVDILSFVMVVNHNTSLPLLLSRAYLVIVCVGTILQMINLYVTAISVRVQFRHSVRVHSSSPVVSAKTPMEALSVLSHLLMLIVVLFKSIPMAVLNILILLNGSGTVHLLSILSLSFTFLFIGSSLRSATKLPVILMTVSHSSLRLLTAKLFTIRVQRKTESNYNDSHE